MRRCHIHIIDLNLSRLYKLTPMYSFRYFSIVQSIDARRSPRQESKISLFVMRAARRQSWTAGRFHASFKMIKHYDRFIGGHDSTVNHRRKRAMACEATRDLLTTRCHSRMSGRASSVEASFSSVFSRMTIFTIFMIFVRAVGSREFTRAQVLTPFALVR